MRIMDVVPVCWSGHCRVSFATSALRTKPLPAESAVAVPAVRHHCGYQAWGRAAGGVYNGASVVAVADVQGCSGRFGGLHRLPTLLKRTLLNRRSRSLKARAP